ncbi:5'-nucleotidase, lipoprotein e(P4) family, partial [Bacillus thuringiensis]|nr:5'-nucleotidase, lipoprotein e(P4) family [Bacillus thuringiensis]
EKGKQPRRELVSQTHDFVLFFVYYLSVFTVFYVKSVKDRNQTVEDSKVQFGEKFIIFPNPMYGDWEGALYDYDFKKSDAEKDKIRRDNLKSFEVK